MSRFASLLLPLLLCAAPAMAAGGAQGALQARITIVTQCSSSATLFGAHADSRATIICEPGSTPFLARAIRPSLSFEASPEASAAHGLEAPAKFEILDEQPLTPPLPARSRFVSKVIYVVF